MSNLTRIQKAAIVGQRRTEFRDAILRHAEEEYHKTSGICSRPFTHATQSAKKKAEELLASIPVQEHAVFRPVIRELKSLHILPMDTSEV